MVDYFQQQLSNRSILSDDRATYSEIARWICVSALLVSLVLAYAWSHNEILNILYQMERLRRENHKLQELNTAFRAEYSSLIDPENIDLQAGRLGLTHSTDSTVKILDADVAVGKPSQPVMARSSGETLPE